MLAIENAIADGALSPGTLLRQQQLAADFGVSRTPVREALRRLEQRGAVTLLSNRSARVRTLSRGELRETFMVRAELEARAAELAALNLSPSQARQLRESAEAGSEIATELRSELGQDRLRELLVAITRVNDEFHDLVLEASRIKLLQELALRYRRSFLGQLLNDWNSEARELVVATARQHELISTLLETGSAAAARTAMHDHILSSGRLMEITVFADRPAPTLDLDPLRTTEEAL